MKIRDITAEIKREDGCGRYELMFEQNLKEGTYFVSQLRGALGALFKYK